MADITNALRQHIEEKEYRFDFIEEDSLFRLGFNVDNGSVTVFYITNDENGFAFCRVNWDGPIPKRAIPMILPVINKVNDDTRYTTLSVDPDTGIISCHSGMNFIDAEASPNQLGAIMSMCISTLDENIENIMRAAWSAPANCDGKYN